MKLVKLALFILAFSGIAYTGQHPVLGKLLSKRYDEMTSTDQVIALISFTDKGNTDKYKAFAPQQFVSDRSLRRRMKARPRSSVIDESDFPLNRTYVDAIRTQCVAFRHELKWFNAVSALITKPQIERISRLPFVKEIELVGRWSKRTADEQEFQPEAFSPERLIEQTTTLDYGGSFTQLNQINVPAVHNLGIYGQGVVVGVFDNGFRLLTHEAFDSMHIIATYDFVDHKVSVVPNNPSTSFGSHGINTLSTIGGFKPGQLIGPAFKSNYILARTENDSSETPIEEDNWAAAIQWADSIGVDVTSTSLGYLTYDAPYTSWTYLDMNGSTTLITNAADRATHLGIVVVNSAGNNGFNASHNTLNAPADGDSVITAGAVDNTGARAGFSSVGPTTDIPARIKPDIMAMGVGVRVASSTNTTGYGGASGTSFSCPLSAGVAALILCANPTLLPMQVREAMRQTAGNAASPDNLNGWGILNADSAIKYYGALPLGKISGTRFNDLNGNGIHDAGEPAISGATIMLSGTMNRSTITDPAGHYSFDSLAIGNYVVSESLAAGWGQTLPESSYSINLLFAADTTGLDFGNFRLGSVSGNIFNDINKNSVKDGGDSNLANWIIRLSGPAVLQTTSDSNGNYTFSNVGPGTYILSESTYTGWLRSAPQGNGTYSVTMSSGLDTTGFLFGNYFEPNFNYPVVSGWNLLSLPDSVSDFRKSTVYPSAISEAFTYRNNYVVIDTLAGGIGYWLKFLASENLFIPGTARQSEIINVRAGWNMIGALSSSVSTASIQESPSGIVTSNYFGYEGGYQTADSLLPHHGYWVKVNADGQLTANTSINTPRSQLKSASSDVASFSSLTIRDANGHHQTLYLSTARDMHHPLEWYALPPAAPEGSFDVRFSSQRFMETINEKTSQTFPIMISSAVYPLNVVWSMQSPSETISLAIDNITRQLSGSGSTRITHRASHISLNTASSIVPATVSLLQNYPNPFNPTTTIEYNLPTNSYVTLVVFSPIGQVISTLVNEYEDAGTHEVEFNAGGLASGVYFYRLTVIPVTLNNAFLTGLEGPVGFFQVRKMLLLK